MSSRESRRQHMDTIASLQHEREFIVARFSVLSNEIQSLALQRPSRSENLRRKEREWKEELDKLLKEIHRCDRIIASMMSNIPQ